MPTAGVIWLSPSPPAERAAEPVASLLGDRAVIAPTDLEIYGAEVPAHRDEPQRTAELLLDPWLRRRKP